MENDSRLEPKIRNSTLKKASHD